jgi:hypothetical protein
MIIILILSDLLFLCLGFWAGRIVTNQAIPKVKIGKEKPYIEEDPYEKAMREPEKKRIETIK